MNRYICLSAAFVGLLAIAGVTATSGAASPSQTSGDEQTLWNLERAYWRHVENNDLVAYSDLWHKDFLGWPSVSSAPVRKDHITDWITSQTGKGLAFKTMEFKPAAMQVTGDVAFACYWVTFRWVDKEGSGTPNTLRITHAWLRSGKDWRIIGGMSMPEPEISAPSSPPSIDGTYELTERVLANGTVLRPPSVVALYTLADGRFNLNLFVKNRDGTIASESTIGRYTFSADKYCEWIVYTLRNNLDKPGVTNEAPAVTDHCTSVTWKNGRFNFSPPGEGVEVSFGAEGFTATIAAEFVDHWKKIR